MTYTYSGSGNWTIPNFSSPPVAWPLGVNQTSGMGATVTCLSDSGAFQPSGQVTEDRSLSLTVLSLNYVKLTQTARDLRARILSAEPVDEAQMALDMMLSMPEGVAGSLWLSIASDPSLAPALQHRFIALLRRPGSLACIRSLGGLSNNEGLTETIRREALGSLLEISPVAD